MGPNRAPGPGPGAIFFCRPSTPGRGTKTRLGPLSSLWELLGPHVGFQKFETHLGPMWVSKKIENYKWTRNGPETGPKTDPQKDTRNSNPGTNYPETRIRNSRLELQVEVEVEVELELELDRRT